jgi:MFS transporter, AAHS family, 4-hydroxybenzoate transporter
MTLGQADAVNVTRAIDEGPIGGFQVMAIVLCSAVAFLDGVDSQSIALAAPLIADTLSLTRVALGPVFSAGVLGAMIGAVIFGPLGDRVGRKRMLVVAAIVFGAFTIATAYANSFTLLLAARFLAGVGLGGATPCFIALASEYAPRRRRATVASLIWAAFPLGGSLGGFVNGAILRNYGWQVMFMVGGILPILVAGILLVWLPESLRFLLARQASAARVGLIVRRIRPEFAGAKQFVADEEQAHGVPLKLLFSDGRALTTLLLWVPFFMSFGILGIAVVWAPIMLHDNGFPPPVAGTALGIHGIGALIGIASVGRLIERFGALSVLVPALLIGAICTGSLGYAATSIALISAVLFLIGLLVGMGASGSIALATLYYPTPIRSSGVGWAMGMGRLGQVLAPIFTTAMIGIGWSRAQIFLMFGCAPVLAAIAIVALGVTTLRETGSIPAAAE